MQILTTELEGVLIIEPKVFTDARGFFFETYQAQRYKEHGIPTRFVQDNFSHSFKNVVRGLHYQLENPQGKLVSVFYGRVLDVIVDIRPHSKTFKKVVYVELSDKNHKQVYIPPGYAHGFSVLSDVAGFHYKCTDYYDPNDEHGVIWNDPDLDIRWGVMAPIVSPKDVTYSRLIDISKDLLPK